MLQDQTVMNSSWYIDQTNKWIIQTSTNSCRRPSVWLQHNPKSFYYVPFHLVCNTLLVGWLSLCALSDSSSNLQWAVSDGDTIASTWSAHTGSLPQNILSQPEAELHPVKLLIHLPHSHNPAMILSELHTQEGPKTLFEHLSLHIVCQSFEVCLGSLSCYSMKSSQITVGLNAFKGTVYGTLTHLCLTFTFHWLKWIKITS